MPSENKAQTSQGQAKCVGNIDTRLHTSRKVWLSDGETTVVGVYGPGTSMEVTAAYKQPFEELTPGALAANMLPGGEALAGEATGEILGSLANQAASALENARLYRELGEREQQLQALRTELAALAKKRNEDLLKVLTQQKGVTKKNVQVITAPAGALGSYRGKPMYKVTIDVQ